MKEDVVPKGTRHERICEVLTRRATDAVTLILIFWHLLLQEKVFANAEEAVKGYREYVAQEQERLLRQKNQQAQVG